MAETGYQELSNKRQGAYFIELVTSPYKRLYKTMVVHERGWPGQPTQGALCL